MFSKISDSPLTDFDNIYNPVLDLNDKDDSRGISPYDLLNTNSRYDEYNDFTDF